VESASAVCESTGPVHQSRCTPRAEAERQSPHDWLQAARFLRGTGPNFPRWAGQDKEQAE
jgi:hypothetical protein